MDEAEFNPRDENLTEFLKAMTELSRKHGIGISHECYLYEMQDGSDTDYTRTYSMTEGGHLDFV